jgi:GTP-binding protein
MRSLIDKGRLLFARPFIFQKGAVSIATLPVMDGVEIAFAGRSNVGKSSLINALTTRKDLARTSNTPGRTQELNFFKSETHPLYMVDMPGYGYAEAPKAKVKIWTGLIKDYLRGRANLARVYVLIDSRHGIKNTDAETLELLDKSAVSYQIVLTKADQIKAAMRETRIEETLLALKKHPAAFPEVILTSSAEGYGIAELRAAIVMVMEQNKIPFED